MVRRVCEIILTLDFIFQLVLDCPVDCSFNIICLDVLGGILLLHIVNAVQEISTRNTV